MGSRHHKTVLKRGLFVGGFTVAIVGAIILLVHARGSKNRCFKMGFLGEEVDNLFGDSEGPTGIELEEHPYLRYAGSLF